VGDMINKIQCVFLLLLLIFAEGCVSLGTIELNNKSIQNPNSFHTGKGKDIRPQKELTKDFHIISFVYTDQGIAGHAYLLWTKIGLMEGVVVNPFKPNSGIQSAIIGYGFYSGENSNALEVLFGNPGQFKAELSQQTSYSQETIGELNKHKKEYQDFYNLEYPFDFGKMPFDLKLSKKAIEEIKQNAKNSKGGLSHPGTGFSLVVDEQTFKEAWLLAKRKWSTGVQYKLIYNDCITFIIDIAKFLELKTPDRIITNTPKSYINNLADANSPLETFKIKPFWPNELFYVAE
jgi:hypothetical protein